MRFILWATWVFFALTGAVNAEDINSFASYPAIGRSFSVSKTEHDTYKALLDRAEKAPLDDSNVSAELEAKRNELPPLFLYHLAERTLPYDPKAALEWYWLGHVRARMDAALCSDTTAAQGVSYLPGFAKAVTAYVRANPNEAGAAGQRALARKDLRASKASPWWICVHGIKAVNDALQNGLKKRMSAEERKQLGIPEGDASATPQAWLRPEAAVVPIYSQILEGAEKLFGSLTAPMEEQTPSIKPATMPQTILSGRAIPQLYWASGERLFLVENIVRETAHLLEWDGTKINELATDLLTANICAAGDFVSYQIKVPPVDGVQPKFDLNGPKPFHYKQGRPGSYLREKSFTYPERMVVRGGYQSSGGDTRGFARWGQSSLTCQWAHLDDRTDLPPNALAVSELGRGLGFLESTGDGTYYYQPGSQAAVKISDTEYPLRCMKYLPFVDAIQMVACPMFYVSSRGKPEHDALLPLALLRFGVEGPTLETQALVRIEGERGQSQTLVTNAGIIRRLDTRFTPVGPRPGGFYWMRESGPVKIWEGFPASSDVSDDGCQLAFTATEQAGALNHMPADVKVWDVCEALEGL